MSVVSSFDGDGTARSEIAVGVQASHYVTMINVLQYSPILIIIIIIIIKNPQIAVVIININF